MVLSGKYDYAHEEKADSLYNLVITSISYKIKNIKQFFGIMIESKTNDLIYVNTNSDKIKEIIEDRGPVSELVGKGAFSTAKLSLDTSIMDMTNFPEDFGANIQFKYGLNFNPSCVIYGNMTPKQKEFLVEKIKNGGLNVAYVNSDET